MNISVDHSDSRPLPVQLCASIRELITSGLAEPGEKLPSTRTLAEQLGVSRGTVVTSFEQLIAEGYLVATQGSGTHINPTLVHPSSPTARTTEPSHSSNDLVALTPGLPDTRSLVTPQWRAAWRDAAAHPIANPDPLGLPSLRQEISHHLRHMRGLSVDPHRIVITAGARDGLELFLRTQGSNLRIGAESPGYPNLRQVPTALGHTMVDVPTDDHGLTIPTPSLDAALVTPSHQYPFGTSMSATRRTELVAWARAHNTWLIEDDFDSELRYIGQPLPALASLDPHHTILLGTFSTVISPSIGCGYIVVPTNLVGTLSTTRNIFGCPVSGITQQALATYLSSGALRRHTGKMRRVYRAKRDLVTRALSNCPESTLLPINGGLHAVLLCPQAQQVRSYAREHGVEITLLADYWGGADAEDGLVLGFGHVSMDELADVLYVIGSAMSNRVFE